MRLISLLIAFSVLSGCMIGADYQRPKIDLPTTLRVSFESSSEMANQVWWKNFKDSDLDTLVDSALKNNLDLTIATQTVEEFYARYRIERSDILPTIDANASYSRQKQSESIGFDPFSVPYNRFSTALNLAWELDIWGRLRRGNEAARADILAQEASRRGVLITVVTSVASTYFELLNAKQQLLITRSTLDSRESTLKLIQERFKVGVITELDVRQVESEVLTARAGIPAIEMKIAKLENLLSLLLGKFPEAYHYSRTPCDFISELKVPAFLPADILLSRPDIIQAEENLRAANARVGVARAAYFPKLSITGAFGFLSSEASDWIKSPSQTWNYAPGIELPIFNYGNISSQVDAAKARYEQALAMYKHSILNGFREVNDALISFSKEKEQNVHLREQVSVLKRYHELANARYKEGQTSYLEALDAERRYFSAQLQSLDSDTRLLLQYIELFKAFGGGWTTINPTS
jgi:outer membrane protein, multidrug efflux system